MAKKDKVIKEIANILYEANKEALERPEHGYNFTLNLKKKWRQTDDDGKEIIPKECYLPRANNPRKRVERSVREAFELIPARERNGDTAQLLDKVVAVMKKGRI